MPNYDKVIEEARERFRRTSEWESDARNNWRQDYRFGHGNDANNWQWEDDAVQRRRAAGRPTMTINRCQTYCNQIINDAMQNKASITVRPVGNGASYDSAVILEGIVRHIEYNSNAQLAYKQAIKDQVYGGLGWWRVVTDYADDSSFNQEIFIRPIRDALCVYLDPFIDQTDGSDATFGFVVTDMDKDEYAKRYPRYKDIADSAPLGATQHDDLLTPDSVDENRVRLMEYFRRVEKSDVLHVLPNGQTMRESDVEDANPESGETKQEFMTLLEIAVAQGHDIQEDADPVELLKKLSVKDRDITRHVIEWYLIAADRVIQTETWPGRYIPLVRVPGTETCIDGRVDRFGNVRMLRDPQRLLNYNVSAGVHFVSIQTMSPWTGDVRAIAGLEEYYRTAHLTPHGILPFKSIGDDGNPIPPEALPRRVDPPAYAPAFMDGQRQAIEEMEIVSGQPPAVMGEQSNERSGKAIQERQRAAANSTYHFLDAFADALRFTGRIIIDLIPHIYDTPRVMKILAQDGSQMTVQVDPQAKDAHQPVQALDAESFDPQQVAAIFSPLIGDYNVVAEVGPQYTTRREQFVSAAMDMMAQNESLAGIVGDEIFAQMDFPGAKLVAKRMRNMVAALHPEALGNTDPQIVNLQKQLAMLHQNNQALLMQNQHLKDKHALELMQKEIDQQNADTNRLKVVKDADPDLAKAMFRDMAQQVFVDSIHDIMQGHAVRDAITQAVVSNLNPQQDTQPSQ